MTTSSRAIRMPARECRQRHGATSTDAWRPTARHPGDYPEQPRPGSPARRQYRTTLGGGRFARAATPSRSPSPRASSIVHQNRAERRVRGASGAHDGEQPVRRRPFTRHRAEAFNDAGFYLARSQDPSDRCCDSRDRVQGAALVGPARASASKLPVRLPRRFQGRRLTALGSGVEGRSTRAEAAS